MTTKFDARKDNQLGFELGRAWEHCADLGDECIAAIVTDGATDLSVVAVGERGQVREEFDPFAATYNLSVQARGMLAPHPFTTDGSNYTRYLGLSYVGLCLKSQGF